MYFRPSSRLATTVGSTVISDWVRAVMFSMEENEQAPFGDRSESASRLVDVCCIQPYHSVLFCSVTESGCFKSIRSKVFRVFNLPFFQSRMRKQ